MKVNEVRKILREDFKGRYKLKTREIGAYRYGNFYEDDKFVVGSSANVYTKTTIEKHKRLWDFYLFVKKQGLYTTKGEKVIL